MTDPKTETIITGGQVQGVAGAGSVVIENFTIYNRGAEDQASIDNGGDLISLCPYPGLAYFGPNDAELFFGRDVAIDRLLVAVSRQSLTALIGASGSGKSSVVLAGLAPCLNHRGDWRFSHFRIGTELESNPFLALSRALVPLYVASNSDTERLKNTKQLAESLQNGDLTLRDVFADCRSQNPGKRILLIADQFEEAFTLVENETVRNRFIDVLLAGFFESTPGGVPAICLILTLRADFYGRTLRYRPFADALQGNVENLGPMNRNELRAAITRPAEKAKVSYESGLVETLLDDVESKPGSLPLLQFALREMWGRQKAKTITRKSYDDIGGVEGALAQRAEAIFAKLTENGANTQIEKAFQRLFTRLVSLGEGAEDTRRTVGREELGQETWLLAQRLAGEDNRLVVTSAPAPDHETAEIIHEALIRNWPALTEWVSRDRAFQSWLRQLRSRIDEWLKHPEDEGTLLRGGPLALAQDWLKRRRNDLSPLEEHFLDASVAARENLRLKEEETRKQELRRQQELAFAMQKLADEERARAEMAEQLAKEEKARAETAFLLTDSERRKKWYALAGSLGSAALFLAAATAAVAAYYANDQLRSALTASFSAQADAVRQTNLVLNNQSLYLAGQSRGEAGRGNLNTSLLLALEALPKNFTAPERPLVHEAISALAHATFLARRIKRIQAHREAILSVAASMDEKWLLSGAADGTLSVRSLDASSFGEELFKTGPGAAILAVETSADGAISAALSTDGRMRIWNTSDWVKPKLVEIDGRPTWMGIDPRSRYVAATSADGLVVLFRSADGERDGVLAGHTGVVTSGSFDPSGQRLVTASDDGTIRIWDIPTKSLIHSITVGNSEVWDVQFNATGDLIATASADGVIRVWNALTATLVRELNGHKQDTLQVIISPRSDRILSRSEGDVILWNVADGSKIVAASGVGGTNAIAFNRDGTLFVLGGTDGGLRVFDASSGLLRASLVEHSGTVMTVAFAARSDRIIAAGDDGQIVIWDLLDRPSVRIRRENGLGLAAVFGQSGASIVAGSWDGVIETRKSVDGSLVSTFQGGKSPAAVTFPPCANGPISASLDKMVRIWDSDKLAHAQEFSTEVPVNRIILDSTCKIMAAVLTDGRIEIRNFKTNSLVHVLGGNSDNLTAVDLSTNGAYLASGYTDGMLRLWDLTSGKLVAETKGHGDEVVGLGFSKDNLLVSASWDRTLKSWNVPDLKPDASADVVGEAVASFVMTDDRSNLITGGWDGRVTVWSLSPLLPIRQWQAHKAAVSSLAYHEGTKLILTSGRDRSISLWDLANGDLLTTLSVSADMVTHSEFSPDATQILINVGGTELQLWRGIGTLPDLVAEARQHLVRPVLSDSERTRFSVTNKEPTVRTAE